MAGRKREWCNVCRHYFKLVSLEDLPALVGDRLPGVLRKLKSFDTKTLGHDLVTGGVLNGLNLDELLGELEGQQDEEIIN